MINIVSVRIRNFRALSEVYFRPKTKGITGVAGANGKGKSSILYATLFALYGALPPHTTKKSLRRIGSDKLECSVSVVFTHMGQTVEVTRELKGNNNTTVVNIYVDGVPTTVTTAGAADKWITQRLGIDEAGFLTAFVVRQKELDLLVTALPSERKAQIEKLAGIDTIKTALTLSRKDEEASKKVLVSLPGSQEAVDEAGNNLTLLSERHSVNEADLKDASSKQNRLLAEMKEARESLNSLQSREVEYARTIANLDSLAREASSLQEQYSTLSYLDALGETADVQALRAKYKEIEASIASSNALMNSAHVRRQGKLNEKAATESRLSGLISRKEQVEESITSLRSEGKWLDIDEAELTSIILDKTSEMNSEMQLASLRMSHAQDLILSLEALNHSSECPTCYTPMVGEAGEKLLARLIESKDKALDEAEAAENKAGGLKLILEDRRNNLALLQSLTTLTDDISTLEAQLAEISVEDEDAAIANSAEELSALEVQRQEVADLGAKAANSQRDKDLRDSLKSRLSALEDSRDQNQSVLDRLSEAQVTPELISQARNRVETCESRLNSNTSILETAKLEAQALTAKLNNAETTYKISKDQWTKKKDLLSEQEKLALTTDMLEKFRANRIAALAPEISEYATSLISDITNGDFVEIVIDENFNTSIIDAEGTTKPVEWLSGGELSAVAFAIRISIGFIITGGQPEFLWLDEPLTAQDTDRRSAMLSTIRSLPIEQIVIINHASEAADIVDETVTLVGNKKDGTRLVVSDEEDQG